MKNKIFDFCKKNKVIILCFILPFIIMNIFFLINGIIPYGDKTLLFSDFFSQYGPMLEHFYNDTLSEGNFLYSFNHGLGQPLFKTYFNYLSSPFNFIIYLFGKGNFLASISFLISLKVSLSSMMMGIFLTNKFKTKTSYIIPLCLFYAFCNYFQSYYFNIMWLDGMIFLPLIILGVENIVNNKSAKIYVVSLFLMIYSNYYIAYMICIFICVYFFFYLCYKTKLRKKYIKEDLKLLSKKIIKFVIYSLLSALSCSFFLVPYLYSLNIADSINYQFYLPDPSTYIYKFEVLDFIKNHFILADKNTLMIYGFSGPNVYCGVLTIFLFIHYLFNKNISVNNKICYLFMMSFLLLAFFFAPLDHVFNFFHIPNDFPYRYSFIYSFVLVIIAAYSLFNLKDIKKIKVIGCYFVVILILLLMKLFKVELDNKILIVNLIFVIIYFIIYILYKSRFSKYAVILLILITSGEIFINFYDGLQLPVNENRYYNLNVMEDFDNGTYRTVLDSSNENYSLICDCYGMSSFSSVEYRGVAKLMNDLGLKSNDLNNYQYYFNTPLFDMMFNINIKYINDNVVKSDYSSELIFAVNKRISEWDSSNNPFDMQNDFASKAFGVNRVLIENKQKTENVLYEDKDFIIKEIKYSKQEQNYFYAQSNINFAIIDNKLYYYNNYFENFDDLLDYEEIISYGDSFIIELSSDSEVVIGYFKSNENVDYYVYSVDLNKITEIEKLISKNKMIIDKFEESKICGTIDLVEDSVIYTSIPYDEGWEVYIDGTRVDTYKINNALLGFDCLEGEHIIELRYDIPLLSIGVTISGITIVSSFVIYLIKRKMVTD